MIVLSSHILSLHPFVIYTESQLLLNIHLIPCHRPMYFCSAVEEMSELFRAASPDGPDCFCSLPQPHWNCSFYSFAAGSSLCYSVSLTRHGTGGCLVQKFVFWRSPLQAAVLIQHPTWFPVASGCLTLTCSSEKLNSCWLQYYPCFAFNSQ